jgi:hypothetical protein
MVEDIVRIVIILVLTWGCYALNEALNSVPKLKQVLAIVIIVVGCLFLVQPVVDIINMALSSAHSR